MSMNGFSFASRPGLRDRDPLDVLPDLVQVRLQLIVPPHREPVVFSKFDFTFSLIDTGQQGLRCDDDNPSGALKHLP